METISAFAIIAFAALIHAGFQLSVSVLTLLSGHALGAQRSHAKLMRLVAAFVLGVAVMTMLLLSTGALFLFSLLPAIYIEAALTIVAGMLLGVGVAVWLFYYRRERGTALWIPRDFAHYLSDRTKAVRRSAEAFSLGMTSVFSEIIFVFAPLIAAALVLIQLPPALQLTGIFTYVAVSLLPLFVAGVLIGSGHKISDIQRWREQNKRFLQFVAGAGLIILGGFMYVYAALPELLAGGGAL